MSSLLQSRFFKQSDPMEQDFVYRLPETWWSRPYEYAWCASFIESSDTALDAACGIPHPFKFVLGRRCMHAYACDWDSRIVSSNIILDAVRMEINEEAAEIVQKGAFTETHLSQAGLTQLPYANCFFDKIFCISVFEHLNLADMQLVLEEFKRTLKDYGIILLTLDYPTIDLSKFQSFVQNAGLEFCHEADFTLPPDALKTDLWGGLYCFRAALKKTVLNSGSA
ncbi:class I SAM-dependent methyltransferase [Paenibacillus planticolens]|uniref:Methyltransferase domain-containing protein n=1 Tax=Paenibacillus planticolens TaxID=2654976 RepID=A0ABX1ZKF8_9BACL|nr:class I SAM-dependent methyltransferase [Paenibacillus planticolens]NOV00579.1 methyltransferase domain-containing protein [Paenibacillus planticolens]